MQSHQSKVLLATLFFVKLHYSLLFAAAKVVPHHLADIHWHPATATWYGNPEGDGSDGELSSLSPVFGLIFVFNLLASVADPN